jgi:dethiobiotin synthetase
MRVIIVTGTNTGVGKTVVTAALAALIADRGLRVAVVKPCQTGVAPDEPGDLAEVARLTGLTDLHEYARYAEPLAPGTAAYRLGVDGLDSDLIAKRIAELADRDVVLVEGSGGLFVHLNRFGDTMPYVIGELDHSFDVSTVLVASAGLGTLNAASTTARAFDHEFGGRFLGVVVGDWPSQPDLAARCNLADLPKYAKAPLVGVLPMGAARLHPPIFLAMARGALSPTLGGHFDAQDFVRQNSAPLPSVKGHS